MRVQNSKDVAALSVNVENSLADLLAGVSTGPYRESRAAYIRDAVSSLAKLAESALPESIEEAIAAEIVVRFASVRDLVPYGSCGAVHDQSGYEIESEFVSVELDDRPLHVSGRVRVAADDDQWVWCRYGLSSVRDGLATYRVEIDD